MAVAFQIDIAAAVGLNVFQNVGRGRKQSGSATLVNLCNQSRRKGQMVALAR